MPLRVARSEGMPQWIANPSDILLRNPQHVSHISKLVRDIAPARTSCTKNMNFSRMPQKVWEMCRRAAQTSPIDRVWSVGSIYDGIMVRGTDRLAVGVTDDRSTSGELVEQMAKSWGASGSLRNPVPIHCGNLSETTFSKILGLFRVCF